MSLTPLTSEELKLQAKRLRNHFAEKNIDISHSAALETLAKQHGYKDWNVLSSTLKRHAQQVKWPELDSKISGVYLGHSFKGKILKLQLTQMENIRRYTILFDEPIDVVKSQHFSSYRQRISCYLDQSLKSVDHKGRPDNLFQLNTI